MRVTGIIANLPVADIAAGRDLYTDYLGLSAGGFNLGWVAHFQSPYGGAAVQLVTREAGLDVAQVLGVPELALGVGLGDKTLVGLGLRW